MILKDCLDRPVLVIGMHRSGTSIVARMVKACNVWMGCSLDANGESLFFQNINRGLLRRKGEYWHSCTNTLASLEDAKECTHLTTEVSNMCRRGILLEHFGLQRLAHVLMDLVQGKAVAWGWKDPRNAIFVPLWKRVYPKATLIAVVRDPRDTCVSLYHRELVRYKAKVRRGIGKHGFEFSLIKCFELWKLYTWLSVQAIKENEGKNLLVHYEELDERPTLENLNYFAGGQGKIERLRAMVSYGRSKYDYPRDMDKLCGMINKDPLAIELGYGR
jgi:hypothetical protein